MLARVVHGASATLGSAVLGFLAAFLAGTTAGCTAAFRGRLTDRVITRATSVLLGMPFIVMALVVVVALAPSAFSVGAAIAAALVAPVEPLHPLGDRSSPPRALGGSGASVRVSRPEDHPRPRAAQCCLSAHLAERLVPGHGGYGGGDPQLPRAGHPGAGPVVGAHAPRGCPPVPRGGTMGGRLPRALHRGYRSQHPRTGRRPGRPPCPSLWYACMRCTAVRAASGSVNVVLYCGAMLTSIHFLLTYACNFDCDHCFLFSGPGAGGTFGVVQLRAALEESGAGRHD